MSHTDLKIMLLNGAAFTLSFTGLETGLKIFLLAISIGYTADRWWKLRKGKKEE